MSYIGGLVAEEGCVVGIDSTGFSLDYSSHCLCIKRADKHKNFLKLSMAADMNSQVRLSTRMRLQRRHDSIDLETVLQRAKDVVDMPAVVADKGYDSEENLSFIKEKQHAKAVISLKNLDKPLKKTKGKHRRKLKRRFLKRLYRQRSKAETVFSAVKREYDKTILSRTQRTKKNEGYFKLITYNTKKAINKLEILTAIEGFYRAKLLCFHRYLLCRRTPSL
ncbi:MAG: transposase [Candidatus Altiarchaeia archaeon]